MSLQRLVLLNGCMTLDERLLRAPEDGVPTGRVLVIGPPEETSELIAALRERGLQAWQDQLGRVAPDAASFAWADAVVVLDLSPQLESEHLLPITEFDGPTLLLAPSAEGEYERLVERGFDFVYGWPQPAALMAALVNRALERVLEPAMPGPWHREVA